MPQNVGPVLFDHAKSSLFHNTNQTPWMIKFNGKLYAFLVAQLGVVNGQNPHFYQSVDNGNTWTELDAANAPANVGDAFVCWDTAHSRAIVCFNTRTAPQTPLQLIQFNLTNGTEVWGVAIAAGGPNSFRNQAVWGVFIRPDTTIAVIYRGNAAAAGVTQLNGTFWNGAAWSAPVDLGLNMPFTDSTATTVQPCSCLMDATGLIHLFPVGVGAGQKNYWGYQQWKADNTLGNFHVFGQGALVFDDSRGTNMVLYGGNTLMLGILSDIPPFGTHLVLNLFVGTPLANPVWTQSQPPSLTVAQANPLSLPTVAFQTFNGNAKAITTANVQLISNGFIAGYLLNAEDILSSGPVVIAELTQADVNGSPFVQLVFSTDAGVTWTVLPADVNPNYNYYLGFSAADPDVATAPFTGAFAPSLQLIAGAASSNPGQIVFIGVTRVKLGKGPSPGREIARMMTGKVKDPWK